MVTCCESSWEEIKETNELEFFCENFFEFASWLEWDMDEKTRNTFLQNADDFYKLYESYPKFDTAIVLKVEQNKEIPEELFYFVIGYIKIRRTITDKSH